MLGVYRCTKNAGRLPALRNLLNLLGLALSLCSGGTSPKRFGFSQLYGGPGVRYDVAVMARSDVQLMLEAKAGNDASFEHLLQRYRTPLVNFLYRMARA